MMEPADLSYFVILVGCILLVCGCINGIWRLLRKRPNTISKYEATVKRDWMTTGRINFVGHWESIKDAHDPHYLYAQVEENRITENMGGGDNVEIRWRNASLSEVKQIVVRYHQFL